MQLEILTPNHTRWQEFCERLNDALVTQPCSGDANPHQFAKEIMTEMGGVDIPASIEFFCAHGGYCDCEILLNVDPWCPPAQREGRKQRKNAPDNSKIIELASMTLAIAKAPDDTALIERFEAELHRLPEHMEPWICLALAASLLQGRPYALQNPDPDILSRCRALAADIGARVTVLGESSIQFDPPTAH